MKIRFECPLLVGAGFIFMAAAGYGGDSLRPRPTSIHASASQKSDLKTLAEAMLSKVDRAKARRDAVRQQIRDHIREERDWLQAANRFRR